MKRKETDLLGDIEVDSSRFYGANTERAIHNFSAIGIKVSEALEELIYSFALIKKSVVKANFELNLISKEKFDAIEYACDEILSGKYNGEFATEVLQGGAGTSMNMNMNEVICNIGLKKMGYKMGEYQYLHPNDDANKSQSTNDTYPSSIKVAIYKLLPALITEANALMEEFKIKGLEFKDVYKLGRTEFQDAVPMTLGQSFLSFASYIEDGMADLQNSIKGMTFLNIGATAIGSGIATHTGYNIVVEKKIKELIGEDFSLTKNLFHGTSDVSPFLRVSSALKRFSTQLIKISNDLIIMSSGPKGGLEEIFLPKVQAGSSIMPGKVNPVIPEFVNQICFKIIGDDTANTMACSASQLELNAYEPLLAYNLISDIKILSKTLKILKKKCIKGIKANKEKCMKDIMESTSLVTLLVDKIGYKNSTLVAKQILENNKNIIDAVVDEGFLTKEEAIETLDFKKSIID